jgi:hypothetical protein
MALRDCPISLNSHLLVPHVIMYVADLYLLSFLFLVVQSAVVEHMLMKDEKKRGYKHKFDIQNLELILSTTTENMIFSNHIKFIEKMQTI